MGLNGFLNFIPFPPPAGVAGQFMGALYVSHYLWVIFAFQVIAGVLLLLNRYVPLAVAMLAPVIVQHPYFPRLDGPERASSGLFVALLWAVISSTCDRPFPDCSSRGCNRGADCGTDRKRKEPKHGTRTHCCCYGIHG